VSPFPLPRILRDISGRSGKLLAISQHALEIISLPDGSFPAQFFMSSPCDDGFEGAHRLRNWSSTKLGGYVPLPEIGADPIPLQVLRPERLREEWI